MTTKILFLTCYLLVAASVTLGLFHSNPDAEARVILRVPGYLFCGLAWPLFLPYCLTCMVMSG